MDKKTQMNFNLNNFALALCRLLDGVESNLYNTSKLHSKHMAFVVLKMGIKLNLDEKQLADLVAYSLFHHLALNLTIDQKECCELTQEASSFFPFLTPENEMIKYSFENHNGAGPFGLKSEQIPLLSQLISFAHTLESCFDFSKAQIQNRMDIVEFVKINKEERFSSVLCDCFLELSKEQSFWLDIQNENEILQFIYSTLEDFSCVVSFEEVLDMSAIFLTLVEPDSKIIEKASLMCDFYEFEHKDKFTFLIATALQSVGKLMLPKEILQKNSTLSAQEFEEVKAYPYYTKKVLSSIMGFNDIASLASKIQEHLDGSGYPYGLKANDLSLKERLIAVLVIYEALRTTKSYHDAFSHDEAIHIMRELAKSNKIDGTIVEDMSRVFETV